MSGRTKIIALNQENARLRELRGALLADNSRLERELTEANSHNDMLTGALADVMRELTEARAGERSEGAWADQYFHERNEARWWACHLYSALTDIRDLAFDYDGYREAPNLMALIDEIREIAGRAQVGK